MSRTIHLTTSEVRHLLAARLGEVEMNYHPSITTEDLKALVESKPFSQFTWINGEDAMALTLPRLRALVALAARAPHHDKKRFIKDWS